jgi:hypothetical protein
VESEEPEGFEKFGRADLGEGFELFPLSGGRRREVFRVLRGSVQDRLRLA